MCDINTKLITAIRHNDTKGVQDLLRNGADIHFKRNLALHCSIENDNLEMATLLLENGAKLNGWMSTCESYALLRATQKKNIELVNVLLKYGADARDGVALLESIRSRRIDIATLLLEHGANVHYCDDECLKLSVDQELPEIIAKLLEYGANIYANECSLLVNLQQAFNEAIADAILPYCNAEDWHYFPSAYIKKRVVITKGARNV